MKKAAFLTVLLIGIGFSLITVDEAGDIAQQYKEDTETVGIHPNGLTYAGSNSYWVMELVGSMDTIKVMLPIDAQTSGVEVGDSMKDVLETHYLANYFTTTETISDFLDSTLTSSQSKRTDYDNAITSLDSNEAQLPSGVYLSTLQTLKDAITAANSKNDALRDQVQTAQSIISSLTWSITDISSSNTALSNVFSKEDEFLSSLNDVKNASNDFVAEVLSNDYLKTDQTRSQAFILIINTYKLQEGAPIITSDALKSNKNDITSFYNGLDLIANSYLNKLRDRYNSHPNETDILFIQDSLNTYQENYTYIYGRADTIPPEYSDSITDLRTAITNSTNYFNKENYSQAKAQFETIDGLISTLVEHIGECPPACTGGHKANNQCMCVCPTGTTETNGQCTGGFSLNMPLIGGLVIIIAILIMFKYKDKLFKGGKKIEEKPDDMWANYKF